MAGSAHRRGERHPAKALTPSGCRLERLTVRAPGAHSLLARLRSLGLPQDAPVAFVESEATGLSAQLQSPRGLVLLPESAGRGFRE